jgi:ATP-binding cassette subfamily B multidrug efflux pump
MQLIPRFYDIEAGAVMMNGVDVRRQSQQSLRAKIAYAPQKASLFSGTVAENIHSPSLLARSI